MYFSRMFQEVNFCCFFLVWKAFLFFNFFFFKFKKFSFAQNKLYGHKIHRQEFRVSTKDLSQINGGINLRTHRARMCATTKKFGEKIDSLGERFDEKNEPLGEWLVSKAATWRTVYERSEFWQVVEEEFAIKDTRLKKNLQAEWTEF